MVHYRLNAGVGIVYFIILLKFRRKVTKESMTNVSQILKLLEKEEGVKIHGLYWTLGRYDGVIIAEGPERESCHGCPDTVRGVYHIRDSHRGIGGRAGKASRIASPRHEKVFT